MYRANQVLIPRHLLRLKPSLDDPRPLSTIVQLATIAIGVGGLSAVYAVIGAVVLRPLRFENPGELVTIDVKPNPGRSGVGGAQTGTSGCASGGLRLPVTGRIAAPSVIMD